MRHLLTLFLMLCGFQTNMLAGTESSGICINGVKADRIVTEISYDENKITLFWNDNTSLTNKIAGTMADLALGEDGNTDKVKIASISGLYRDNIVVSGVTPGSLLCVYDFAGKMLINSKSQSTSCELDISRLNTGIYLLKADNEVIKFIKQ